MRNTFREEADETIEAVLVGRTPAQLAALKTEYRTRYNPDREDALEDHIRFTFDSRDRDRALALLEGNLAKADAMRLRYAMLGLGTTEHIVWQTLENKTSERRAAIAQEYQRLYTVELEADIRDDFRDTPVYGPELTRTLKLLYGGGLSDAERLYFAIEGLGTDKAVIHQVLGNRSRTEIDQIRTGYLALTNNQETLDQAIAGDLGGRDLFDAQLSLRGRPESDIQKLIQLKELHQFERQSGIEQIAAAFLDEFNSHGMDLDRRVAEADAYWYDQFNGGQFDSARFNELICFARQDVATYRETIDTAAEVFGTSVSTVAGMAVIWATAGTTTPLVLTILAGSAGAAGQVLGQVTVAGSAYDLERLPADALNGFANGATSALTFAGLPNAQTTFGRILQGAVRGYIDGTAGGFIGGVVGASLQDGVWSSGLWEGMTRVGEAGVLSALVGGISGGVLGGILAPRWHECFAAGTLVATEGGLKPIERIEAGEHVWAYNFRTAKWELRPVVEPLAYDYAGDMTTIEVEGERIEATGHHPFWVIEGEELGQRPTPQHVPAEEPDNRTTPGRWVDARDLRIGDVLLRRAGTVVRIQTLLVRVDRLKVYNLHVAELHTYSVGEEGVLVHNRLPLMPKNNSSRGTWNDPVTGQWTRSADEANGTFTTYDEEIRKAATKPGQQPPDYVSVTYTSRYPDFSPHIRDIDGVRGEVGITLDTDPTLHRTGRENRDFGAADRAYADLLTQQGKVNEATGQPWTARDVRKYLERHELEWHHVEDVNLTTHVGTMQLIPKKLNNWFLHKGGRSILDDALGLPKGER